MSLSRNRKATYVDEAVGGMGLMKVFSLTGLGTLAFLQQEAS